MISRDVITDRLRRAGVPVTLQRVEIAQALLSHPMHLSVEQALTVVRRQAPEISRATMYNTLKLFRDKNLVRELIADPDRVIYDSNTTPHHHYYNVDTGELGDITEGDLRISGAPVLPAGAEIQEIDVIVRIRNRRA